jgi:hypothetical protein
MEGSPESTDEPTMRAQIGLITGLEFVTMLSAGTLPRPPMAEYTALHPASAGRRAGGASCRARAPISQYNEDGSRGMDHDHARHFHGTRRTHNLVSR